MKVKTYDLAIILLNYNGSTDTIECIESIDKQKTSRNYSVFILDNGSANTDYLTLVNYFNKREDYQLTTYTSDLQVNADMNYFIRSEKNFGFAKGNNNVIRLVMDKFKYVVLLNNDTIVDERFVDIMIDFLASNSHIKYASCRINNYYDRSLLWNCGGKVLWWGNKHYFTEKELENKEKNVKTSFISGCALFLDTLMLKEMGLLSEDFFHGEEDFNFCWRMKAAKIPGYCLKETLVYHKISVSSKKGGVKNGKIAGYYANRIIDMHKFYPTIIWEIWRRMLVFYVVIDCIRKHVGFGNIKDIVKLINKYAYNTQLTYEDCIEMKRF